MSYVIDRMPWPATPQDMYAMLLIEDIAKNAQGLTHQGLTGFVMVIRGGFQREVDESLYGFSVVDMYGNRVDPQAISASTP